jgi:hypothetical protein
MSSDYITNLVKALKDHDKSEIILNITSKEALPIATVYYKNNSFHIKKLENNLVESYPDIESTSFAIESMKYMAETVNLC